MFTATRRRLLIGFTSVPILTVLLSTTTAAVASATAGWLDPNFGTGGKVTTDFIGNDEDTRGGMAVQNDGGIAVAGATVRFVAGRQTWDFGVAHYLADGTPDASFGNGGKVTTDFGTDSDADFDAAYSVAVQGDRKVIAAGVSGLIDDDDSVDMTLARYNVDGTLDASFGSDGTVVTDFRGMGDWAQGVAVQADGKIVASGSSDTPDGTSFALARYNANGTLDASFGTGGKVITDFPDNDAGSWGLAIQRDGKIIAVGSAGTTGDVSDFALARYNIDGTLDPSFGRGGQVITAISAGYDEPRRVVVQEDGRIVVVGGTGLERNNTADFALARYNADGTLDGYFGVGGKVITSLTPGEDVAFAVALQPGGKIVVAGGANYVPMNGLGNVAVVRYNGNGTLDRSFGTRGTVTTDFANGADNAFGIGIQRGNKIVVAGVATLPTTGRDFALARYLGS